MIAAGRISSFGLNTGVSGLAGGGIKGTIAFSGSIVFLALGLLLKNARSLPPDLWHSIQASERPTNFFG